MEQNILLRQLIWLIAWGIAALFCIISLNRNKPELWQEIEMIEENKEKLDEITDIDSKTDNNW